MSFGSHSYRRHLPHWRDDDALYFVTFRLADSIPVHIMTMWEEDRKAWMAAHGLREDMPEDVKQKRYLEIPPGVRHAFERDQARRFFVELDRCHGSCVLRNPEAAQIVASVLQFHHGQNMHLGDFVIMPNHVHAILFPYSKKTLEGLLQSAKRYSAVRINALNGKKGTLWQKESFDHIVRDDEELSRIRQYIANNPAKAHLKPDEYFYHRSE